MIRSVMDLHDIRLLRTGVYLISKRCQFNVAVCVASNWTLIDVDV